MCLNRRTFLFIVVFFLKVLWKDTTRMIELYLIVAIVSETLIILYNLGGIAL